MSRHLPLTTSLNRLSLDPAAGRVLTSPYGSVPIPKWLCVIVAG
jgi:hypothetical protein